MYTKKLCAFSLLGVCPKSGKNSIQDADRIKINDKENGNQSKASGSGKNLSIYSVVLLKSEAAAIAAPAVKG